VTEDLILYFDKPDFSTINSFEGNDDERIAGQIKFLHNQTHRLDLNEVDVAIIGVCDARNSIHKGCANAPDESRAFLYGLRRISKDLNIIDLGNLRGKTIDDRYHALEEITIELIKNNVTPIIIGGGQDYTIPLCGAVKKIKPHYRLSVVDSKIDWQAPEVDFSSSSFIGYLCDDNDRMPRDISIVGTQRYLISPSQQEHISEKSFDMLRMGHIRQFGYTCIEPLMRDADIVSVDMTAVRQCDQPSRILPMPNGLTGEEMCQLFWYAGQSDNLKILGVFELDTLTDINKQGTVLQAQCLWHILEGIALRYKDYPAKELDKYRQFIVHLDDYELDIKFYNNPDNNRWWVEIPRDGQQPEIVACEKRDFDIASNNEIPERWFRFFQKRKL